MSAIAMLPEDRRQGLLPAVRVADVALMARFGIVGILNTLVGYACFAVLIVMHVPSSWALALAMLAGVLFNYQTSRHVVFRSRGRLKRFVFLYVVVWAVNWAALKGLLAIDVAPLLAQAGLTLPIAALSFIGQRLFVFRSP